MKKAKLLVEKFGFYCLHFSLSYKNNASTKVFFNVKIEGKEVHATFRIKKTS